ncbi:MFS transporter [Opitutaceae bacterium]|nr:MFS transporter [Opitutaceae bacterium]
MDTPTPSNRNPWSWIPSLYFAQGIPNIAVATLSVVMYKNLGISNTDAAFYTSLLYLPWVIKPLWAPFVELRGTKRFWIVALQYLMGGALGLIALTVPAPFFFQATLAVFWLVAFSSATHDIAADGFYLLALSKPQQAAFVGVRSTFFRLSMIVGSGFLVFLAGRLAEMTGEMAKAWAIVFAILSGGFLLVAWFHSRVLPRLAADVPSSVSSNPWRGWWTVFSAFFRQTGILSVLGFLLLFRIAEAQLLKLVIPFMLDEREVGGLALTNEQIGIFYGTFGVVALTIGGLIGGWLVSQYGLRKLLWWMVAAMHVPNLVFVGLAIYQPTSLTAIGGAIVAEQLGYGFGFTAYMVYMMMVAADGPHKTAHYAICTGFMALGIMLPGMVSGWIQEQLGYQNFFIWVVICAVPSIAACAFIKIDQGFGRKG